MCGPCMCGDPYCSSCGPAQGNYKCGHCGHWTADGECTDACEEGSRAAGEATVLEYEEMERHAAAYEDMINRTPDADLDPSELEDQPEEVERNLLTENFE